MKELIIWTGPVHSGKSTRALLQAERYRRLGHDVVLVRPSRSVRPDPTDPDTGDRPGMLVTKTGHRYPSIEVEMAVDIVDAAEGANVVWIDEPMLFEHEHDIAEVVGRVRAFATVLVSGLAATSELDPFGRAMPRLLAVADTVHWCKADCDHCHRVNAASRSFHRAGPKSEQVRVGGAESYEALCPQCWTDATAVATAS